MIGRFHDLSIDYKTGDTIVSFATTERPEVIEEMLKGAKDKPLEITIKPKRNRRSKDANAMLWACLSDLAKARNEDNWSLYLEMLRKYGEFTYICVKPSVVDSVKQVWRETQEIGEVDINGQKAIQLLCFFGSHTYDTKQFSRLLEGVQDEMAKENLSVPLRKDIQEALERWEKK